MLFAVLAGSDSDPAVLGGIGQPSKFHMPFGDELVGERIIRALDGSEWCRAICIAAPPGSHKTFTPVSHHPTVMADHGPSRMASMASALRRAEREGLYAEGEYVMVVTGDLPLLTRSAIDHFLSTCAAHPQADCYVGMIPLSDVDEVLHGLIEREGLAFRGQPCLHTDVYLLRPASMSEKARRRFDSIMSIRRTGRTTARGFFKAAGIVLEIVGLRGLVPFVKVVTALPNVNNQRAGEPRTAPDRLENSVLDLIEEGFGLRLCLLPISEPALGLGFDYVDDLRLLVEFDEALAAETPPRQVAPYFRPGSPSD